MSKQEIKSWAKTLDQQMAKPVRSRHETMCYRSAEWAHCAVGETVRDILEIPPGHAANISRRSETLGNLGSRFHSYVRVEEYANAKKTLAKIQAYATKHKEALQKLAKD